MRKLLPLPLSRVYSNAYTLIELIVVISVISILAALLIPSVKYASAMGKASACASNMHQLSTATSLYLADHENVFYPHTDYVGHNWYHFLNPYLKNYASLSGLKARDFTLICPNIRSEFPNNPSYTGYGKNGNLGANVTSTGNQSKRANGAYQPAEVVIFWDEAHTNGNPDGGWPSTTGGGGSWYSLSFRHNNKCHILFLDGHIESVEKKQYGNAKDYTEYQWGPYSNYPNATIPAY